MGGSAFSASRPSSVFPRIPPAVYAALKARLFPKLLELYTYVGVPTEAPEKNDHGDLDFLVAIPTAPFTDYVPHGHVKDAIGAEHLIPMDGNRTSHYAISVQPGEWECHGGDEHQQHMLVDGQEIYYQVDIHVCESKNEWDRIMFYHSYGDLGMILGLIARNNGLKLGANGLDVVDPPNPPFRLSDSFDDITRFLGLSMDTYLAGFRTKHEVFRWAASCEYFDRSHFRTTGPGIKKVKPDRLMYAHFVEWVHRSPSSLGVSPSHNERSFALSDKLAQVREEALIFFGKKQAFEGIVKERLDRQQIKDVFSGSCVRDWADLGNNWKGVKFIMDKIRQKLGGNDGVLEFFGKHGEDGLRQLVLQVKLTMVIEMT